MLCELPELSRRTTARIKPPLQPDPGQNFVNGLPHITFSCRGTFRAELKRHVRDSLSIHLESYSPLETLRLAIWGHWNRSAHFRERVNSVESFVEQLDRGTAELGPGQHPVAIGEFAHLKRVPRNRRS